LNKLELVQVNIARLIEPLDSKLLEDFVANLEPVNAEADKSPGFVWRLKSEEGDATSIKAFEWDVEDSAGVVVNMSKWESLEALKEYVYKSSHVDVMRRRFEWFHKVAVATTALWWVPEGHIPTIAEAEGKLRTLRNLGPTPEAFNLRVAFDRDGRQLEKPAT
jgi:hypothetical protein